MKQSFGAIAVKPPNIQSVVDEWNEKLHPALPQLPFFVGVVGPRFTGKSVLLHHLLTREPGMYGSIFEPENIVFYKPTKEYDPTFDDLKLPHVFGPETDCKELMMEIERFQRERKEEDDILPTLLVLDDITEIRSAWSILEHLGYVGRHFHLHGLFVAHKMSSITRHVRTQCMQWMLFKPHEQSEREWIYDSFSTRDTKDIWKFALERCWEKKYNFVFIDFCVEDPAMVYRSGFHEPLFTSQEEALMRPSLVHLLSKKKLAQLQSISKTDEKEEKVSETYFIKQNDGKRGLGKSLTLGRQK
jgi:hypothetical protein